MTTKRIESIDILRAIAIFMMVMSSTIGWHCGLPAWMFHGQVPPPDFVFDPSIKGITWVDLVFPFFLFSMGAAMPFSIGGKIRRRMPYWRISLELVKRWVVLAAFGVALGNSYAISGQGSELIKAALWCGMFLALWRVPEKSKIPGWAVNVLGVIVISFLFVVAHFKCGFNFSVHRINIIIMILSLIALLGGFIWLLTRKRIGWRILILVLVIGIKELTWQTKGTDFHATCLDPLAFPDSISWLFSWGYIQYLVVCILGTMVGDILMKASSEDACCCATPKSWRTITAAIICILMVPAMLWGLYTRRILITLDIAAVAFVLFALLTRGEGTPWHRIAIIGYVLVVLGVCFDWIDGGITKDYCNMSYMFTTSGLASLVTAALLWGESHAATRGRKLSRNFAYMGQNPMIAYTVTAGWLSSLLYLCGFAHFDAICTTPLIGILRGVIVTCCMMAVTCAFTRAKIFWRS